MTAVPKLLAVTVYMLLLAGVVAVIANIKINGIKLYAFCSPFLTIFGGIGEFNTAVCEFSQWPLLTGMRIQSMPLPDWNGNHSMSLSYWNGDHSMPLADWNGNIPL